MTHLRWQDVAVDSIWRELRRVHGEHRLVRVLRVDEPDGPDDRRLVSVMIRTVMKNGEDYRIKPRSRLSFTTIDRLGRNFEVVETP